MRRSTRTSVRMCDNPGYMSEAMLIDKCNSFGDRRQYTVVGRTHIKEAGTYSLWS